MSDENSIASKTNGKSNPPWRHKFITPKKQKPIKKSWLDETPAFLRYNTYHLPYYSSILESSRKPRNLSYEAMRNVTAVIALMEDNGQYLFEESSNNFETQKISAMTTASLVEKENEIQHFVESIFQNDCGEISSSSRTRSNKILDDIIMHKKMNEEDTDVIRNGIRIAIQKCAPIVPLELQKQCLVQIGSNRPCNYPTCGNNVQLSRRPPESRHDHHGEDHKATTSKTKTTTESLGICYFLSHPKWTDPNLILFTTLIQHACKMMRSSGRFQPSQEQGGGRNKHILTKVATEFFALVCCDKNIVSRTTADGPSFAVSSLISNLFSRRSTKMKRRAFKKILWHFLLSPYDHHKEYNNVTNNKTKLGNVNMSCISNNNTSKIDKKLVSENNSSSRSDTGVLLHQNDHPIRRGETATLALLSPILVQNSSSSSIIKKNTSNNTGATRSQEEQNMSSISTGNNNNTIKKSNRSKNFSDKQENEEYDTSPIHKKVLFADDDPRNSSSSKEPNNNNKARRKCRGGRGGGAMPARTTNKRKL